MIFCLDEAKFLLHFVCSCKQKIFKRRLGIWPAELENKISTKYKQKKTSLNLDFVSFAGFHFDDLPRQALFI